MNQQNACAEKGKVPHIFIVKTIIEQFHDRLQDDGISEDRIRHVDLG
jgi:hypothetical protein